MASDCYSNYWRDVVNDYTFNGNSFTPPATLYCALMSVLPTAAGGGTEISSGGYARQAITRDTTNWPLSSGQQLQNGVAIDFGTNSSTAWSVVGVAFYDASSAGNLIVFMPLTVPVVVATGQPFQFPINAILFDWAA